MPSCVHEACRNRCFFYKTCKSMFRTLSPLASELYCPLSEVPMSTMLFNILIVSTFEALEKASMVPLVRRMVANARPLVG